METKAFFIKARTCEVFEVKTAALLFTCPSGPTHHLNRKRRYMEENVSNCYGAEWEEEPERRANLLAKKQSKIEGVNDHTDKGRQVPRVSKCSYFGK